jgi:5'-nucleotidase
MLCLLFYLGEGHNLKILVTNDDGIHARGLWALVEELCKVGEVVVVAPDREQSAVGTAVTLHHPLRLARANPLVAGVEAYSVEGTPADSVILALGMPVGEGVEVVVSGINEGPNLGDDVLISGTVGAALQGNLYGIPSMALSVAAFENVHFEVAAKLGRALAGRITSDPSSWNALINVNLPNLPIEEIRGIEITRLAHRTYADSIKEGHDGRRKYYWIVRGKPRWNAEDGTDRWALNESMISITPLRSNLAGSPVRPFLREIGASLFQELRLSG